MRVVGNSGTEMDVADHVATGLLASGVVTRVKDTPVSLAEVIPPPAPTPHSDPADPAKDIEAIAAAAAKLAEVQPSETNPPAAPAPVEIEGLPAGNASREAWEEFALAHGKTEDDLLGLNRDAIRALFVPAPAAE